MSDAIDCKRNDSCIVCGVPGIAVMCDLCVARHELRERDRKLVELRDKLVFYENCDRGFPLGQILAELRAILERE